MIHSAFNQSRSGCSPKMIPRTVRYLHSLLLKNRQASASDLAQGVINGDLSTCDSSDSVKDIA